MRLSECLRHLADVHIHVCIPWQAVQLLTIRHSRTTTLCTQSRQKLGLCKAKGFRLAGDNEATSDACASTSGHLGVCLKVHTPHSAASLSVHHHTHTLLSYPTHTQVLSYHVIPTGALNSGQLAEAPYPTALADKSVSVTLTKKVPGGVRIIGGSPTNVATVVVPNIRAGRSMIHVINAVLVPAP